MKAVFIKTNYRFDGESNLSKKRFELIMQLAKFFNEHVESVEYNTTQLGFSFQVNPEISRETLVLFRDTINEIMNMDIHLFLEEEQEALSLQAETVST